VTGFTSHIIFLANAGIAKISDVMIDVIMKVKTARVNIFSF